MIDSCSFDENQNRSAIAECIIVKSNIKNYSCLFLNRLREENH